MVLVGYFEIEIPSWSDFEANCSRTLNYAGQKIVIIDKILTSKYGEFDRVSKVNFLTALDFTRPPPLTNTYISTEYTQKTHFNGTTTTRILKDFFHFLPQFSIFVCVQ